MAILATNALSALEQISSLNTRAVFGGSVLILLCLIAASLFKKNTINTYYIFLVLIGTIALVSGVLIASALFVAQNPSTVTFWRITL